MKLQKLQFSNRAKHIFDELKSNEERYNKLCKLIPSYFKSPENISVRIKYAEKVFFSANFRKSNITVSQKFKAKNNIDIEIKIFCNNTKISEEFINRQGYEKIFLKGVSEILIKLMN